MVDDPRLIRLWAVAAIGVCARNPFARVALVVVDHVFVGGPDARHALDPDDIGLERAVWANVEAHEMLESFEPERRKGFFPVQAEEIHRDEQIHAKDKADHGHGNNPKVHHRSKREHDVLRPRQRVVSGRAQLGADRGRPPGNIGRGCDHAREPREQPARVWVENRDELGHKSPARETLAPVDVCENARVDKVLDGELREHHESDRGERMDQCVDEPEHESLALGERAIGKMHKGDQQNDKKRRAQIRMHKQREEHIRDLPPQLFVAQAPVHNQLLAHSAQRNAAVHKKHIHDASNHIKAPVELAERENALHRKQTALQLVGIRTHTIIRLPKHLDVVALGHMRPMQKRPAASTHHKNGRCCALACR
eukprot:comp15984_c0_seq1/m.25019 comp15984_c0_seq1/g.25019  ORF comp15984_c0_seq1/g.25019 comp15984_c0_seq1/m.25019 type:complete len:367 (-) comp15984_c0_seq1:128-1228(-)